MAEAAAAAGNITIKNKYTGEVLGTVPADTAETLRKKINKCE
ncbi:MAG: hypothetical protein Q6373_016420 [Candidatus Sigynarchaeota archaeon]